MMRARHSPLTHTRIMKNEKSTIDPKAIDLKVINAIYFYQNVASARCKPNASFEDRYMAVMLDLGKILRGKEPTASKELI